MKTDFFALYDAMIAGVEGDEVISSAVAGDYWSLVETKSSTGIAMTTDGDSIAPMYPQGFAGMSISDAAKAAASWNLAEAGFGLASVNAFYNTRENLERLHCYEPFENYCTRGLDFTGKTVGLIGHLNGPAGMREQAKEVYIIERHPKSGDYPDSACEYLLPRCDIVLITGSSLVNKTLPRLLELCRNAYTILTGPSVPMCPALLDFGIDRLAGMIVSDRAAMLEKARNSLPGSPYPMGTPFLLMAQSRR